MVTSTTAGVTAATNLQKKVKYFTLHVMVSHGIVSRTDYRWVTGAIPLRSTHIIRIRFVCLLEKYDLVRSRT